MEKTWLSFWDFIIPPIHLAIIFVISYILKRKFIQTDPNYKYFQSALFLKILGGIGFALIYSFYYPGGDSTNYYEGAITLQKLSFKDTFTYFSILGGNLTSENHSVFDMETGWPLYYHDPATFSIVRLASVISYFSFRSFFSMTILFSAISFAGVWKLFQLFSSLYPQLTNKFAIAILYFPSVLFWGSGVLKDSVTLMAACWFTYSFYHIFIKKKDIKNNVISLVIMAFLMILIKPYIFIALMPGTLLWFIGERMKDITNWFVKILLGPVTLIAVTAIGVFIMTQLSSSLGDYSSADSLFKKASESQKDLKQAYYMGNSFDIGEFEPTFQGVMAKFPVAVMAGLYRPYLWDVKNVVMLISALENTILLGFTLLILYKVGIFKTIKHISNTPILFFSIIFAVFFAFSVGISTANFGALVRYRIPCIPFLVSSLFILGDYANKKVELDKEEKRRKIIGLNKKLEV